MNADRYKKNIKERVTASMLDYMREDGDCGYSEKDVKKCEKLLSDYIDKLSKFKSPADDAIMKQVKGVVIALNKLNEKTDYCLIETDAREEIWQIIQDSAVECGLSSPSDDITEEWREW